MKANCNTLRYVIRANRKIHFEKDISIASLLGFNRKKLSAYKFHISDFPINITKVNYICIDCNLFTNSYNNETPVQILHMFYPDVPTGFRIIEKVSNAIYLPISTNSMDNGSLQFVD